MEKVIHSIELSKNPNSHCVFAGIIILNQLPLYLGLYVDDFCFFSENMAVVHEFKHLLETHFTFSWDEELERFLGIHLHWKIGND